MTQNVPGSHTRVLVVEDDSAIRNLLVAALRREAFAVDAATDGVAALELVRDSEYAVIVLDLMMPRLNGFDFLDAFAAACPTARSAIFVLSAFDDRQTAKLRPAQVHAILKKPFDLTQVVTMIREVVALRSAQVPAEHPSPAGAERDPPHDGADIEPPN